MIPGLLIAVLLGECGGDGTLDLPTEEGTSSAGTAPKPQPTPPPADDDGVHCLPVPAEVAGRIASASRDGIDIVVRSAHAVRSPDFEDVYFVAMGVTVDGDWVPPAGLSVWAISTSVWRGERGPVLAANPSARRLTTWPPATDAPAHISETDHNVGEAEACSLR